MTGQPADDAAAPASGRKARTRRALLDAAEPLFEQRGVDLTSVEEIAEAAGVSVGTLYLHFRNKEALSLALVDEALSRLEVVIAEARSAASPLQRVMNVGDAYLRLAIRHPMTVRLGISRSIQPEDATTNAVTDRALWVRVQQLLVLAAGDLKQAMDVGEIEPVPVDELMVMLWGMWSGVVGMVVRQDTLRIPPELGERALHLGRDLTLGALRIVPTSKP